MAISSTSGQGRPKGSPNKITTEVKEMVLAALDKAGGIDYLVEQAHNVPNAFLALIGKVIPVQVHATIKRDISDYTDEELAVIAGGLRGDEGVGEAAEGPGEPSQLH